VELLTISQAAERIHLSTRSVRLLVAAGKIRAVRIGPMGGRVRFTPEDLDDYLHRCRQYGSPARALTPAARRPAKGGDKK
jgi:excisionase family DNA binding protein